MVRWRGWTAAALLALSGAAAAQGPEQAVIEQLARQGYMEFEVSRTLLGRIRVVALAPNGERREIVFNPATGEILRDLTQGGGAVPRVLDRPTGAERVAPDEEPWSGAEGEALAGDGAPEEDATGEGEDPGDEASEEEGPDREDEDRDGGDAG